MEHLGSVTKGDEAAISAAEERAYADAINDALAWLIEHDRTDLALQMRADFVAEEPAKAVATS